MQTKVAIGSNADIIQARQKGRALAIELGFDSSDVTLIATAISEMARNIVDFAHCGEIILAPTNRSVGRGISIIARDQGPGITDINRALQYGFSTRNSPGVGLSATRWLVDEFDIQSTVGKGTTVKMKKWVPDE